MKELCAEHRPVNRIASTNVCSCNSANGARTEEGAVPDYEYLCSACSKKFSIVFTLAEHEKGQVKCQSAGARKSNSNGPHFTRRRLRRAELHEWRAAGNPTSFGIFQVRLVFESTGWNARCALTTLRNGAI